MSRRTTGSERRRLAVLRALDLLDRPAEPVLEEYVRLVADVAGTPIALISLVDAHRQWFAGRFGLEAAETPRSSSFCAHAIQRPADLMWVSDARDDPRFHDNPLVLGHPHIRFYAGAPLIVNNDPVGALCVIDPEPRAFDGRLAERLRAFAAVLAERLQKRHRERQLALALEATSDAIITCDEHGLIEGWRHGAERLFGYTEAEAIGQPVTIIVPPAYRARHDAGMARWRKSGDARLNARLELPAIRKDGQDLTIELCMSVTRQDGEPVITATIRDITERRVQAEALKQAKMDAEAANAAKSAFLAKMSHELRTPLNGVVGLVDVLASSALPQQQAELVSIVQQSSRQLEGILGDVLDLARIESGQFSLVEGSVALDDIVSSAVNLTSLRAHEKALRLWAEIDPDLPRSVLADAIRLKQILTNLLNNAVKFTDSGAVWLTAGRRDGLCRFEVHDTGIGIDQAQQDNIFEPFRQADDSISRRFSGTGLGLSICRDLVTAMGGHIGCSSTPHEGSVFWFEIPLKPAEDDGEAPGSDAIAGQFAFAGLRVLMADDNVTNRRVVELMLATVGATITGVEDGAEAVNAFLTEPFDLVLMDMMMPVMDGLSAVRAIREHEEAAAITRTPIVMLTANAMPEHVAESLSAGADRHLAKPITVEALFQAIAATQRSADADDRPASEALA